MASTAAGALFCYRSAEACAIFWKNIHDTTEIFFFFFVHIGKKLCRRNFALSIGIYLTIVPTCKPVFSEFGPVGAMNRWIDEWIDEIDVVQYWSKFQVQYLKYYV